MRPRRIKTRMVRVRIPTLIEMQSTARARGKSLPDFIDEMFRKEMKFNVTKKKFN